MAKKSKTQRAKASAARAARKEQQLRDAQVAAEANEISDAEVDTIEDAKKKLFKRSENKDASVNNGKQGKAQEKGVAKKAEKKPAKKSRLQFLKDVKLELKRVTWPTKQDVLRWSVVVVVALLFFGVYVALLDNVVITPVLVGISGLAGLGA
ncbi:preprotein translocase subunit SecE [Eggerthellaceae bacterium 3-80]|nr:preprotein translocase subunit SecE [bacterium D16-34]